MAKGKHTFSSYTFNPGKISRHLTCVLDMVSNDTTVLIYAVQTSPSH